MSDLYSIIKSLQTTQGNNAKLAILQANKDNELLKWYMKAVFDPAINYYQTKLPKAEFVGKHKLCLETLDLIKDSLSNRRVTGHAAINWLREELERLDKESQELIAYIINRKIIGAKVGETMVLKTWPNLFFIPPYMRCKSMDKKVREHYSKLPYFIVQLKADGSFAYLQKTREGVCKAITRQGSLYPSWFAEKMLKGVPEGFVLVGEMQVYQEVEDTRYELLDRKTGNGVLNSVLQGGEESEFSEYEFEHAAWDMLTEEEFAFGKSDRKYKDRWCYFSNFLATSFPIPNCTNIDTWFVTSVKEANEIHTKLTSEGKEGTVWKTPDGLWKDSDSGTIYQVKNKVVFEVDLEIIGYYEGEGEAKGSLGKFTVATSDRKLVNNVGSGISDKLRLEYWKMLQENPNCFDGCIATIEANDVTDSKSKDTLSLSSPIFIEIRSDKKEADSIERVLEQLEAAQGR